MILEIILLASYALVHHTIVDLLFPSFLHHHCLQILYTTNFLRENVFISCLIIIIFISDYQYTGAHVLCNPYILVQCTSTCKYDCMTKSSRCNSHVYCLATQCLQLCYICSCSRSKLARQALPLRSSFLVSVQFITPPLRISHRNGILFLSPPLISSVRLQICSVHITSQRPPLFSISIIPNSGGL